MRFKIIKVFFVVLTTQKNFDPVNQIVQSPRSSIRHNPLICPHG